MEVETSRANHRDAGNNNATKTTAAAPKQATDAPKPIAVNGAKPTPPPKVKPPRRSVSETNRNGTQFPPSALGCILITQEPKTPVRALKLSLILLRISEN
ncbi:hypothetical protein EVAR_13543_1 [Eumeta japonica]|uniref:Uncharacterized protein n=1 Tax=Eumeta variegata TaxID=151549 RepID=A0A4C1U8K4_EUMVA|nr:hypothetical protein EVAR_13543_1 [Eumeta japonica]